MIYDPIRPAVEFLLAIFNSFPKPFISFWYMNLGLVLAMAFIALIWRIR